MYVVSIVSLLATLRFLTVGGVEVDKNLCCLAIVTEAHDWVRLCSCSSLKVFTFSMFFEWGFFWIAGDDFKCAAEGFSDVCDDFDVEMQSS